MLFCFTALITEECPLLAGCAVLERAHTVFTTISILFYLRCTADLSAVDGRGIGHAGRSWGYGLISRDGGRGSRYREGLLGAAGNENTGNYAETQNNKNALRGCHDVPGKGFMLDVLKNVPNDCYAKSLKPSPFFIEDT